jgi:hypothetical protein
LELIQPTPSNQYQQTPPISTELQQAITTAVLSMHPWLLSLLSAGSVGFFLRYVSQLSTWMRREFHRLEFGYNFSTSKFRRTDVYEGLDLPHGLDEDLVGIDWGQIEVEVFEGEHTDATKTTFPCMGHERQMSSHTQNSSLKRLSELAQRWSMLLIVGEGSPMADVTWKVLQEERDFIHAQLDAFEANFRSVKMDGDSEMRKEGDGDGEAEGVEAAMVAKQTPEWKALRIIWSRFFQDVGVTLEVDECISA